MIGTGRPREYSDTLYDESTVQSIRDNLYEIKCPMIFASVDCCSWFDRPALRKHLERFHEGESSDPEIYFDAEVDKILAGGPLRFNDRHEAA